MQIVSQQWLLVDSIGCYSLYENGKYGSAQRWVYCKNENNPAEEDSSFTTKNAAYLSMLQAINQMIKNNLGRETLLTQRQQTNILKKLGRMR